MRTAQPSKPVQSTKQLADYLGLSRWTVSRVLNGHSEVNGDTARRVVEAARLLGFSPNLLAQGLRRGRTRMVGVILPDLATFNLTAKIEHLQERLAGQGYQTLFSLVKKDAGNNHQALQHFMSMRVAGLITFAADWESGDPWVENLKREEVPVVHVDPLRADYGRVVRTDREHAMKLVLEHLVGLGHRRIVVAGIDPQGIYGRQRLKGLKSSSSALGLAWDSDIKVLLPGKQEMTDFELGVDLSRRILALKPAPSAVIALNDEISFGLMSALARKNIKIPGALSLAGYDNEGFSAYSNPALTTVDPRVEALMDQAVDCLFEKKGTTKTREIRLKPKLIIRGTTGVNHLKTKKRKKP